MKFFVFLSLSAVIFLCGCRTDITNQSFSFQDTDGNRANITFNADGSVNGFSGVNRFFGSYRQNENKITLHNLGSTRMAGHPAAMKFEDKFLDLLNHAAICIDGNTLVFRRNGQNIMQLAPAKPDKIK